MPKNREEENTHQDVNAETSGSTESTGANESTGSTGGDALDLDLEGLDLTVETVEERISPSETNVFDK